MRHTTLLLTTLALGCGGDAVPGTLASGGPTAEAVTLVYSSRLEGEIEPCG